MPTDRAFNLYSKSASKKKSSKRQPGEGCSNPSAKKARTGDPPTPTPTKETTPPPIPVKETTPPPTSVNQNPPAPVEQTSPAAPADLTPPASTDQTPAGRPKEASREDLTSVVLNSAKDRMTKITKHRRSREAI
ncbi:classical arabinogalactan protein 9-like [Humulus lupulus]|uniref:classical arabinogalactan protein 9-like n=1 Tax=Humulus lupulus TaxID=3486 RepID=UPI002B401FF8|nr:classical arabinogalactan protein 9-like [Humulus lupulus]